MSKDNHDNKSDSCLHDSLERFLNGEQPCSTSSTSTDERYDKIWIKLSTLEENQGNTVKLTACEKVTGEELQYVFEKWSSPGTSKVDKGFIEYCVKKCNKGDLLCLTK